MFLKMLTSILSQIRDEKEMFNIKIFMKNVKISDKHEKISF